MPICAMIILVTKMLHSIEVPEYAGCWLPLSLAHVGVEQQLSKSLGLIINFNDLLYVDKLVKNLPCKAE